MRTGGRESCTKKMECNVGGNEEKGERNSGNAPICATSARTEGVNAFLLSLKICVMKSECITRVRERETVRERKVEIGRKKEKMKWNGRDGKGRVSGNSGE